MIRSDIFTIRLVPYSKANGILFEVPFFHYSIIIANFTGLHRAFQVKNSLLVAFELLSLFMDNESHIANAFSGG